MRHIELIERQRLRRNGAEHRAHAVELAHDVDAKAALALERVGEVGAVLAVEALDRLARHDLVQRFLDEFRRSATSPRSGESSPFMRMRGGSPAMKCRSEPRRLQDLFQELIDLRHVQPAARQLPRLLRGRVASMRGSMLVSVTNFWNSRLSVA